MLSVKDFFHDLFTFPEGLIVAFPIGLLGGISEAFFTTSQPFLNHPLLSTTRSEEYTYLVKHSQ